MKVTANRGYDNDAVPEQARQQNMEAIIPSQKCRQHQREYDSHVYKGAPPPTRFHQEDEALRKCRRFPRNRRPPAAVNARKKGPPAPRNTEETGGPYGLKRTVFQTKNAPGSDRPVIVRSGCGFPPAVPEMPPATAPGRRTPPVGACRPAP